MRGQHYEEGRSRQGGNPRIQLLWVVHGSPFGHGKKHLRVEHDQRHVHCHTNDESNDDSKDITYQIHGKPPAAAYKSVSSLYSFLGSLADLRTQGRGQGEGGVTPSVLPTRRRCS